MIKPIKHPNVKVQTSTLTSASSKTKHQARWLMTFLRSLNDNYNLLTSVFSQLTLWKF